MHSLDSDLIGSIDIIMISNGSYIEPWSRSCRDEHRRNPLYWGHHRDCGLCDSSTSVSSLWNRYDSWDCMDPLPGILQSHMISFSLKSEKSVTSAKPSLARVTLWTVINPVWVFAVKKWVDWVMVNASTFRWLIIYWRRWPFSCSQINSDDLFKSIKAK